MTDENFNQVTRHSFNMPIELHCLMQTLTPGAPRLVIEVFSGGDGIAHQTLEGYGLLTCSPNPGHHQRVIGLWRPQMSGFEQMKSVFVGGSASLVDRETVGMPYEKLATEALHLDATVRKELAEQKMMQQQMQEQQQQQQMQQQQQDGGEFVAAQAPPPPPPPRAPVAPLENLPPEVENDIAIASSMACHSRAGMTSTSEGRVRLSVMCFVQSQ